jgi:peroxiredoxin (alkyl hydroperoxide reductase subunit C)
LILFVNNITIKHEQHVLLGFQTHTKGDIMKTVGDKLEKFAVTGVKPGQPEDAFFTITDESFPGKWKVIVYYPKDFTFVCPTEIVAYDKLTQDFEDRDAILLTGSTDNEFCKVAWQKSHSDLSKITHLQFADTQRGSYDETMTYKNLSLVDQLGVFYVPAGAALRATFIVDPDNVIQHVTVNNLNVGRSPEETLRVLDALQTGELCACNRTVGGETL